MAIYDAPESLHVGNGVETVFGFNWPYLLARDLLVTVNGQAVPTVMASTNQVSITPAPTALAIIRISRNTPAQNPTYLFASGIPMLPRYIDGNNKQLLYALQEGLLEFEQTRDTADAALEAARLAQIAAEQAAASAAQQAQDMRRTVRVPATDPEIPALPEVAARANKVMGFDALGRPVGVLPASGSGTELALDLYNPTVAGKGGDMVRTDVRLPGSLPVTLAEKSNRYLDAVLDFGADPTGQADSTAALLAFFKACIASQLRGWIPRGTYSVVPGGLDLTDTWAERAFPHIGTAGYSNVFFVARADVDAPMLRITNGTATAATYRLWLGGSLGGITFVDPFASSTATKRDGLSIYGMTRTTFGHLRGLNLSGSTLKFERKMLGNNPDPYNVALAHFDGVEADGCHYGINHDNDVGSTHCSFRAVRVIHGTRGGLRGVGVASAYNHISIGDCKGRAVDVFFDVLTGGRTSIKYLELDNVEYAYNIEATSLLVVDESRIIHRFQTGLNTAAVYWPLISYNLSKDARNVVNVRINGAHRVEVGGSLATLGTLVHCNNSVNLRGIHIDLDITEQGGFTIPDRTIVVGLSRSADDVVVARRAQVVASTKTIAGSFLNGAASVLVGKVGFPGAGAKLIFPTEVYDRRNLHSTVTGECVVPYTALYRMAGVITLAVPIGTRVRVGFGHSPSPTALGIRADYAATAGAQSYPVEATALLNAGDIVYFMADHNATDATYPLTGSIAVGVENSWSVVALQ